VRAFLYLYNMELLKIYQKKLNGLKKEVPGWAKEAIIDNKGIIVNIVKNNQLSRGLNSLGSPLAFREANGNMGSGFYAEATQSYANADNIPIPKTKGTPYNFQWTGETFDNMKLGSVNKSKKTYDLVTVRGKQKLLESIYGEIFDLTEEHNDWVNKNLIEPFVAKKIQEAIASFI
jgi:hypothetical protein